MRRLCRGVDDRVGADRLHEVENPLPVAHVDFVMDKSREGRLHPLLVPPRVATRTEEHGALVVVDAVHRPAQIVKVLRHFAADQPGRTSHENFSHICPHVLPVTDRENSLTRMAGSRPIAVGCAASRPGKPRGLSPDDEVKNRRRCLFPGTANPTPMRPTLMENNDSLPAPQTTPPLPGFRAAFVAPGSESLSAGGGVPARVPLRPASGIACFIGGMALPTPRPPAHV